MIVVDTNVIAYRWLPGERRELARRVQQRDADWHVPSFWRSEFRNTLCAYLRRGELSLDALQRIRAVVEGLLAGNEHAVLGAIVLDIAAQTSLSAYDCEYVALAETLGVPLVTEDRRVLAQYPGAVSMESFLANGASVHSPRSIYRVPFAASAVKAPRRRRASLVA